MKDMNATRRMPSWTTGWSRRSLLGAISCAILAISACGGDSVTAPIVVPAPTTPIGSYDIQSVNGKPIPVTIEADDTYSNEITVGTVALTAAGTWSALTTTRVTIPGNVQLYADSNAGVWTQTGNSIQLTSSFDGAVKTATWDKGLLTLLTSQDNVAVTLVYYQRR